MEMGGGGVIRLIRRRRSFLDHGISVSLLWSLRQRVLPLRLRTDRGEISAEKGQRSLQAEIQNAHPGDRSPVVYSGDRGRDLSHSRLLLADAGTRRYLCRGFLYHIAPDLQAAWLRDLPAEGSMSMDDMRRFEGKMKN